MTPITLPAHFDGEQIRLDRPYPLDPETRLLVVVFPDADAAGEREGWFQASTSGLAGAYVDDEIEYSSALVKEANPEYVAGR